MAIDYSEIPDSVYDQVIHELYGNQNLKERSDHYEFVCPVCGDMRFPNKRKAWIYKDTWKYICFKCPCSMPFASYLKQTEPETYSKLIYSAFGTMPEQRKRKEVIKDERPVLPVNSPFVDGELIPITSNHPLARAGLDVCRSRRIRPEVFEKWFVCLEGNQFFHRDAAGNMIINPNTGKPEGNEYKNRIIIPFYRFGGKWTQFDARAIDPNNPLRYLNLKNVRREAYNIDFIRFDRPYYILEGTIDSTFIPNAIGIGGVQHLGEVLMDNPKIAEHKENCVFIWDNDDAGRTGRTATCRDGYKWFDWEGIIEKDVNSEVLHGCNMPLDVDGYVRQECIDSRTRLPGGSDILFMLKYGNVAKEKYKETMRTRREANLRRIASMTPETYF
jgi:predicted RNA-binding Zn-ribbon protein involved in translation (DUF1610 family)